MQKAYEFLMGGEKRRRGGADPDRLLLVLQAQCVLYRRYSRELSAYKYAGYPMLLEVIKVRGLL